jgi:hypothetical protein
MEDRDFSRVWDCFRALWLRACFDRLEVFLFLADRTFWLLVNVVKTWESFSCRMLFYVMMNIKKSSKVRIILKGDIWYEY